MEILDSAYAVVAGNHRTALEFWYADNPTKRLPRTTAAEAIDGARGCGATQCLWEDGSPFGRTMARYRRDWGASRS